MKKSLCVSALLPFIVMGTVFASDGSVRQLSDVNDTIDQLIQEQRDSQGNPFNSGNRGFGAFPGHNNQPTNPNHPPQPAQPHQPPTQPTQPHHPPTQPHQPPTQPTQPHHPPPQPPAPVDTTHAYNEGLRDGRHEGDREGKREGYRDGVRHGETEGNRNGTNEGDSAGRAAGKRDGWNIDYSAGTLKGSADGQNIGINNGTEAGKRRCYDEGYTFGYNTAYAAGKELGLQDAASYSAAFARGQADASVMEAEKGQKAGYQAGFSQREGELQLSLSDMPPTRGRFALQAKAARMDLPIELVRKGFTTPEERRAYERGYREGYDISYWRAYRDAKQDGYDRSYTISYRQAYDGQYPISYRIGLTEGREQGYNAAYSAAYNSAYEAFYEQYSRMEYAEQRSQGRSNGQAVGQREGFAAGCAVQAERGYKAGYEETAASVYPVAFEAGKQSGIAAADKYYSENSVIKVSAISLHDENNNGKFEANESVIMKADISNFGFQTSGDIAIIIKSERGEIALTPDLRASGVGGRSKVVVDINIGKLYDVVAPNADTLSVKFTEKDRLVGDLSQMYTRTNANKVGIVTEDNTAVRETDPWLNPDMGDSNSFFDTVATLKRGNKVLIIGKSGDYYNVRKSAFISGKWKKGYISDRQLKLQ